MPQPDPTAPTDVSDAMRLPASAVTRRFGLPSALRLELDPDELRLHRGATTLLVAGFDRMGPVVLAGRRVSFRLYEDNGSSRRVLLPAGLGSARGLARLLRERRALARGRYRLDPTELAEPAFRRLPVDAGSVQRWGIVVAALALLALASGAGLLLGVSGVLHMLLLVLASGAACAALWLGAMLLRDAAGKRGYLELDLSGFTLAQGGRSVAMPWVELLPIRFDHTGLDPKHGRVTVLPRNPAALTQPLVAVPINRYYSWGLPARSLAILMNRYRQAALERNDGLPPF